METIRELTQINYGTLIISVFTILCAFKFVCELLDWFIKECEDTKRAIKHDKAIKEDLAKLTSMFVEKEINDYRWEINNFATKISENKPINKDCFKHCFKTYALYEKILDENDLKNGEVENSMKIINDAYQEKMKNGKL